jgi:hypothetical protein
MVVGVYAVAMPTLVRKGWRLPFAGFFSDSEDEGEDEAFKTAFEMPRGSDVVLPAAPSAEPVEVPEPLPPVQTINLDEVEDDPTLTPLFEGLDAEVAASTSEPAVVSAEATEAPAGEQKPHLMLVHSQPAEAIQAPEATPEPVAEAPVADPLAGGDDMLSLFAEDADAGKGPNLIREAAGDVSITDLMEEVRKLREILDQKRAA